MLLFCHLSHVYTKHWSMKNALCALIIITCEQHSTHYDWWCTSKTRLIKEDNLSHSGSPPPSCELCCCHKPSAFLTPDWRLVSKTSLPPHPFSLWRFGRCSFFTHRFSLSLSFLFPPCSPLSFHVQLCALPSPSEPTFTLTFHTPSSLQSGIGLVS